MKAACTQKFLHTAWNRKETNTTFYEPKLTTSSWKFFVTLIVFFTQSYNKEKKIMKCKGITHHHFLFYNNKKKESRERVRASLVFKSICFLDSLLKKPGSLTMPR